MEERNNTDSDIAILEPSNKKKLVGGDWGNSGDTADESFDQASEFSSDASDFMHYDSELDGAIVAGGAADLYSRDYIGLLANYAAVGIVYGAFPSTIYPFLKNYLNMESYQAAAASSLVNLPWSFKTLFGVISDSFPIFGYRRRSYMILGWGFCCGMLLVLAFIPMVDPYYVPGTEKVLNKEAPNSGHPYIVFMMLASFGYLIADVAADGMTVELAQREPLYERGRTQTTIYLVRTVFGVLSKSLIAFSFNGKEYGGDFDWSLSYSIVMLILAAGAFIAIPYSYFFLKEDKAFSKIVFSYRCQMMWKILKQRAIWQILAFEFSYSFFANFQSSTHYSVQKHWGKVKPFSDSVVSIISSLAFALSLYIGKKFFLNISWRSSFILTTIFIVAVDAFYVFFTIYGVVRNQWFYLLTPLISSFPSGLRWMIALLPIVEVSPVGFEATAYGLITTVHNLAFPFSTTIYKIVGSYFDAYDKDVKADTPNSRNDVAYTYMIAFACNLFTLATVLLLPADRIQAQKLRKQGGSSSFAGVVTLILVSSALTFSITTNLMSIFPSTSCLKIAGGSGC